ncbi:dehydrogenase [Arthrobacter sp. Soil736]|uniref:FAD-binding oxidoreductase n=1 Tax=Arthrobacter sp. Soil736 TaxID=1736395 RepID=UPI0006F1E581|nr:FAD-binding oxidoreductase [Arthrobacter sp. Soil736]KRE67748.1 dehydrogenase [Arthrobacter sp. Soil736]
MNDTYPTSTIDALAAELRSILGERGVSTELAMREKASIDGAKLSPVIMEQLPLGLADLVAFPATAGEIVQAVGAAVRHGVSITPRGKGTGNYGQAIPMPGGMVLDLSRAKAILDVGDGFVTAEAGATMIQLETAARAAGQELLMYPSTAQSTIGGFLSGGSCGTGSIEHGVISESGFVVALDVVHAVADPVMIRVEGAEAQSYLHNYGTAGIIVRATVKLEPLREWRAFYASFPAFEGALSIIRELGQATPTPRLVSADLPMLAAALPADAAIPAGRASLRAILDVAAVPAATALVERAGGRVEDVRVGPQAVIKLSMISYNHPIEWLQKAHRDTYFHVEVAGDALIERIDEVHAVYSGGMLHIEAQRDYPIGMLAGRFESKAQVEAGLERLKDLGVRVHNPHQWFVDFEVQRTMDLAAVTDPFRLLNPGKLVRDEEQPHGLMTVEAQR